MEGRSFSYLRGKWVITAFFESSLAISIKMKNISNLWSNNFTPRNLSPGSTSSSAWKSKCVYCCLFKGQKHWKQSKCPSLREKLNNYRLSSHWIIMQPVEVQDLSRCRQFYKIWFCVCTLVKHSCLPLSRKTSACVYNICIYTKVEKSIVLQNACLGINKSEGGCGGKALLIHSLKKHTSLFKRKRIPRIKQLLWYIPFM